MASMQVQNTDYSQVQMAQQSMVTTQVETEKQLFNSEVTEEVIQNSAIDDMDKLLNSDKDVLDVLNGTTNSKFINDDGSVNYKMAGELFENGELSAVELLETLGIDSEEYLNNGFIYANYNGNDLMMGRTLDKDDNLLNEWLSLSNGEDSLNATYYTDEEERTEYLAKQAEEKQAKEERTDNIKSKAFNENGSVNPEGIRELVESGEMSIFDFINACGYDLKNQKDQASINLTRSDTFNFTLPDGTEVSGLASDWSGSNPYLYLATADGQEYKFEYNS